MRNTTYLIVLLSIFSACVEPYEIADSKAVLDVFDGKLSTVPGRSVISVFQQIDDSTKLNYSNLDVEVLTADGDVFPFYFDLVLDAYVPNDSLFTVQSGTSYRVSAVNSQIQIESVFETAPEPFSIGIQLKDTFRLRLTALNIIEEVPATAVIANVAPPGREIQGRLYFDYSYINPLTTSVQNTSFRANYVTYACESAGACFQLDSVIVPVGQTSQQNWFFRNELNADCYDSDGSYIPVFPCVAPCCQFEEEWNTEFRIVAESMSKNAYEYWVDVRRLTNNSGLIFDTFPFPTESNITCEGCSQPMVGYFRVIAESFATQTTTL